MIILLAISWVICGGLAGAYWWRYEYNEVYKIVLISACILGPFSWILGFLIHGRYPYKG